MVKKLAAGKVFRMTGRCVEFLHGPAEEQPRKAILLIVLDQPLKYPYKNSFRLRIPYELGPGAIGQDFEIILRPKGG